jgi:protein-S-isoprenylcysteine O-methyltransferase Ste14
MTGLRKLASRLPPPLLFVLPLLIGTQLERLVPLSVRWDGPSTVMLVGGWAMIALGIAAAGSAVGLFVRRWTTIVPHGRANVLVSTGPFRWSRNPMYVGLTILYLGVCALSRSPWCLALLPVPLLILQRIVIPMEEQSMLAVFGTDYDAYSRRVRRWL